MSRQKHTTTNRHLTAPLIRFTGLLIALITLVSGVTYAALQSQDALVQNSTISSSIAALQLSSNGVDFTDSIPGFVFGNIKPGGQPMPNTGYPVYIKNTGTTTVALTLAVKDTLAQTGNMDMSKVHVLVTPVQLGGTMQDILLSDLVAQSATGGVPLTQAKSLMTGASTGFFVQVSMEKDAVNGPGASLSHVDFAISGVSSF